MDTYHLFGYIAAYATLLPIAAGILVYKKADFIYRLFLFYVVLAFCIDFFKPFIKSEDVAKWMYWFFSITEVVFITWFLKEVTRQSVVRNILKAAIPAFVILWIICYFVLLRPDQKYSPLFDTSSAIFLSCFSALLLLQITQQGSDLVRKPEFWFVGSVFFSFFCASFLFGLMNTDLLKRIWYLYRIITILNLLMIMTGFLFLGKMNAHKNENPVTR